jgi:hypothetical protein
MNRTRQRARVRIVKPGKRTKPKLRTVTSDFDGGYVFGASVVSTFYGWIVGQAIRLIHPFARLIVACVGFLVGLVWFAFMLGAVCWIAEHLLRKYNR